MHYVDMISPGGESALSYSLISQDTEIIEKICPLTNTSRGFEEVCRILSLNRVKITAALEEYMKRTIAGDWNEENAAWICSAENATKYGHHELVEKLMGNDKINEISYEMKEKLMLNAVRADSSETLKKLQSHWNIIPDQVVAEALKRGVADVIACLEKHNVEVDEEKKQAVQRAMKQRDADLTIFD